ncbi:DedA family protein [Sulfurimonas sp. HSL1-2]|uniref:DedA family protein n=1 Tax=Thiomicrolovo zhangzhouensis TaxID=3131933 RepID=UPI0031FA25D6
MLEALVMTYGYAMIAAGTFLEGETVLVIGGYLAHAGYLELPWVIVSAFAGSFAGDQLYFFIGRRQGTALLEKRPRWQAKSERVRALLQRRQNSVIVGFRFLYGLRTVTPFLLGASGIAPGKFMLLNAAGAALWAVAVALAGYLLGHAVTLFFAEAHRYALYGALFIAFVAMVVWVRRITKRKR